MTRILWHSSAPWDGTGYGTQTGIWTRWLRDRGHDVAISAYHGMPGSYTVWDGIPVFPPPLQGRVDLLIPGHAAAHKAELIIVLADVWLMDPRVFGGYRTAVWLPTDTSSGSPPLVPGSSPLGVPDAYFFRGSQIAAIAMSRHGQSSLKSAGLGDLYVPHGIDTGLFRPPEDRRAVREQFGLGPSTFAAGINANNVDPTRKAYGEQFAAFARFHAKHPDSVLLVHTLADLSHDGSLNLPAVAQLCGISDCVRFCDQYTMQAGGYTPDDLAAWYGALDVLMNATYGEGFGLPAVEAQACGTPVILSDGTTGPELCGSGWLVRTQRWLNRVHYGWWHAPLEDSILDALEHAWLARRNQRKRDQAREFALGYDTEKVGLQWDRVLGQLTAGD